MSDNSRDLGWAIGTAIAFLLVAGGGGLIASRAIAAMATPTSVVVASPSTTATVSPTASPTGTPTPSPTPSPTATPAAPSPTARPSATATPNVRRLTSAELTLMLQAQVEAQRAQFRDGRVRFVPPDQVVIAGTTAAGGQSVPVEAVLTVGVDGAGRPKVLAYRLTQGGRAASPVAQAALAARVTQTNSELDQAVPRAQRVKRIWVTVDAINGELSE